MSGATDHEAIAVLEPLLVATSEFEPFLKQRVWLGDLYSARRADLIQAIHSWITVLEARRPTDGGSTSRLTEGHSLHQAYDLELTSDEAYALCQLVLTARGLGPDTPESIKLATRAQTILFDYIKFLEQGVQRDLWGGNISRIQRLGTYVEAWNAATLRFDSTIPAHAPDAHCMAIVLKVLSMIKQDQFSNGSIFHSSLPTVHLARSLILLWHWPSADKPLLILFSRVLDDFVVRTSDERVENLELHKQIIVLERNLVEIKGESVHLAARMIEQSKRHSIKIARERRRRYVVLAFAWVGLSVGAVPIVDISYHLSRTDLLTFAGITAGALAIVLGLTETMFRRKEVDGESIEKDL